MPNIYHPETWGALPKEAIAKLALVRELILKQNEKVEEPTELDWETEF